MTLPLIRHALVVVAHPDDESFGLGGILDLLTRGGTVVSVLCFTHGEASTLHSNTGDLFRLREAELAAAATVLDVRHTRLLSYPDGALAGATLRELVTHVRTAVTNERPSHILVFDEGGVTGHPDHARATEAAARAAKGLPILAWTIPDTVAEALNTEFSTTFRGRPPTEIDWTLTVDRTRQWRAIAAHASQSADNPVLRRRLALLGDTEHIVLLEPHRQLTRD